MPNPVGLSFPTFSLPTKEQVYKTFAPYVNRATGINIMPTAGAANIDAVRNDVNNKLQKLTGGKMNLVDAFAQFDRKNKAANNIGGQLNKYLQTNNSIGITSYKQLMSPDALKRLETVCKQSRPTVASSSGGYQVKPPGPKINQIVINLEDPRFNNRGGRGQIGFSNAPGSSLTSQEAINNARAIGIKVDVFNSTKGASFDERSGKMVAILTLPNTGPGGKSFADITTPPGGYQPNVSSYKVPPESIPEFKKGYADRTAEIDFGKVLEGGAEIAKGLIGIPSSKITANVPTRRVTTESVLKPRSNGNANPTPGDSRAPQAPQKLRPVNSAIRKNLPLYSEAAQSRANANATRKPYVEGGPITGQIAIRKGLNLSKLGKFKLESQAALAKRFKVPEGELLVSVVIRHGESQFNLTKTTAGNDITIATPDGNSVRPPPNVFTSMPNGELLKPGGQVDLTERGVQQARAANSLVAELVSTFNIKKEFRSPVNRAQKTADEITKDRPQTEAATVIAFAERGQGPNVGRSKVDSAGQAIAPNPNLQSTRDRPVTDRTGYQSFSEFNKQVGDAYNKYGLTKNNVIYAHQYVSAAILNRVSPRVNVQNVGHGIENSQPLVLVYQKIPQGPGIEPIMRLLHAGYYRGNKQTPGVAP